MDHSGHYCPKVVLCSKVMHGVLPWIIVISTVNEGISTLSDIQCNDVNIFLF